MDDKASVNMQLNEIYGLIRDLTKQFSEGQIAVLTQIADLKLQVAKNEERSKNQTACPFPGEHPRIEKRVAELEEWKEKIDLEKSQATGSLKAILWICGILGPILGSLGAWAATKLNLIP